MVLEVTITLKGKTWNDVSLAIEEIQRLLSEEYLTGFNSNETGSFHFDVTGEEEENTLETLACYIQEQIEEAQLGSPEFQVYADLLQFCSKVKDLAELQQVINEHIKQIEQDATFWKGPVTAMIARQKIVAYNWVLYKITQ